MQEEGGREDGKERVEGQQGKEDSGAGKDAVYPVKVDGKEVYMTLEELRRKASEAAGAQRRFEEAAEMRRKASAGMRLLELVEKINEASASGGVPDRRDLEEFVRMLGGSTDAVESFMEQLEEQTRPARNTGHRMNDNNSKPIQKEDLAPELQRVLDSVQEHELQSIREKIITETRKGVDNDPILSKMLSELPDDSQEEIRQTLYEIAEDKVRTMIVADGKPFGPQMVQEVAQRLRAVAKNLGKPARGSTGGQPPMVGLGPGAWDPYIVPDKPVERVPSSHPDYIDNRVQATLQRLAMKSRTGIGSRR